MLQTLSHEASRRPAEISRGIIFLKAVKIPMKSADKRKP